MSVAVQVIGLCRWSYPSAPGAFQRETGDGMEALRAALYDPVRLELRLFFLEHVVLPPLRAQTDPDFTVILLMGDRLPADIRARVLALIADVPQVRPKFEPEGQPHQEVCRKVMLAARDPDVRAVAEIRMDDDDAVAVDLVERTRDMFARTKALFRTGGRLALDFNKGYILRTEPLGIVYEPVVSRYWGCALVLFLRPQGRDSMLDFNHAQLWKRIPTVTFPRVPMYLRGAHGGNDSSVSTTPHSAEATEGGTDPLTETLRSRFALDRAALDRAWADLIALD